MMWPFTHPPVDMPPTMAEIVDGWPTVHYIAPCPCGNPAGQWTSARLPSGGTRASVECDQCEPVAA